MTAFLFAVAFIVVTILVYLARHSGRVQVVETRVIDAPVEQTRGHVVDLRRWPGWSPWPEHAPATHHSLGGDAAASSYRWSSEGVEMGAVEDLGVREGSRLEQRLRLVRPFPLRGISSWRLAECDGGTRVTWSFRGRVALSMRAFSATVQGALALDFRYGLDRLASLVEGGSAPRYAVLHAGIRELAAIRYAYVEHTIGIGEQSTAMRSAASELRAVLARTHVLPAGRPLALYLKTDIKRRTATCRFCVPIGDAEVEGVAVATLPRHTASVTILRGSRERLEVAWYLAMQRLSMLAIQPDLGVTPSERYLDELEGALVSEEETELLIPVRSR